MFGSIIYLASFSAALTNQDYQSLQNSLRQFIFSGPGPKRNVPLLVRSSFHDLSMIDGSNGMGPNGCLLDKTVQQISGHAGLSDIVQKLNSHVLAQFPNTKFPFGDVVSMAGKVAIETALPCLQIPWSFGRAECRVNNPGQVPSAELNTTAASQVFLDRYKISHNDFAILLAGGHGLDGAQAFTFNSGFGGASLQFAFTNSGKNWIESTLQTWTKVLSSTGKIQFIRDNFVRLPVDLFWFPTVAQQASGNSDPVAAPVETFMKSFTTQDRSSFDREFARVYAKMLNIGVSNQLTPFSESSGPTGVCDGNYAQQPSSFTAPIAAETNSTSAIRSDDSTTANSSSNSFTLPAFNNTASNIIPNPVPSSFIAQPVPSNAPSSFAPATSNVPNSFAPASSNAPSSFAPPPKKSNFRHQSKPNSRKSPYYVAVDAPSYAPPTATYSTATATYSTATATYSSMETPIYSSVTMYTSSSEAYATPTSLYTTPSDPPLSTPSLYVDGNTPVYSSAFSFYDDSAIYSMVILGVLLL